MHGGSNGLPLVDDLGDMVSKLFPTGEGVVRATNPHSKDAEGGAIQDDIGSLETIQEGGKGEVICSLGAVGGGSNEQDVSLFEIEPRTNS